MSPADGAPRARRIALISDWALPRRGGIELHLADLSARLAAAGHAVSVLTPTPAPPAGDGDAPDGVRIVRLDVPRLPGAGIAYTPALARALHDALTQGGYDVVHTHASVIAPAAYAGVAAARRLGVPCVVTFHSLLHATARLLGAADAITGWARAPLALTGVSARVAGQLQRALPRACVRVLPNATDVAWWRGAPDAEARATLASLVPPRVVGELRIVTAMRLTRKKRTADLLRVVDAARAATDRPVRLIVAGDGPDRALLARAAAHAEGAVGWLGWQPRRVLRALYADADLFVLPSAHESFGIAALEARAAGLPVVGRAATGLVDFVQDGVHGTLARDAAGLVASVATLARDRARLADRGAASRASRPHAFDWTQVVAQHVALYDRVDDAR